MICRRPTTKTLRCSGESPSGTVPIWTSIMSSATLEACVSSRPIRTADKQRRCRRNRPNRRRREEENIEAEGEKEEPLSILPLKRTTQIHLSEMLVLARSIVASAANLVRADGFLNIDGIAVCQRSITVAYFGDKFGMITISMETLQRTLIRCEMGMPVKVAGRRNLQDIKTADGTIHPE